MTYKIITVQRHIMDTQRRYPQARGEFSDLLSQIILAAKVIYREVSKAGLSDVLGATDDINVHGERVMKLDKFANTVMIRALDHGGHLCIMASEENEDPIPIPEEYPSGKYVLLFDPLDGSSNIAVNVSVGSIFSIHRKISSGKRGKLEDLLQPGYKQAGAGYIIYGSSTMLVFSTGVGVHGFTLDPSVGEFLLSHENMQIPESGAIYSCNEGYFNSWSPGVKEYILQMKQNATAENKSASLRYTGSMVADIHRTLLYGGIFLYPGQVAGPAPKPEGKLRLLYECAPMAYLIEQAGGRASDGLRRILDIAPDSLHQRVPFFAGSSLNVLEVERLIREEQA
ncbi:class 1 fructose-bisphosphatase [candidate division CSSED10-310 bacterium]|uniref:Fructose-1,6-bisphosphatase class 1 n=1 Tax=candidate division CSSED10-310 bacterium TaxID=2855610 RepID=A0ABV6YV44_UNCC1